MSYVNAGYIIALSVLFVYSVSLIARRRRLLRAAQLIEHDDAAPGHELAGGIGQDGANGDQR
jgi:hypothetical protein